MITRPSTSRLAILWSGVCHHAAGTKLVAERVGRLGGTWYAGPGELQTSSVTNLAQHPGHWTPSLGLYLVTLEHLSSSSRHAVHPDQSRRRKADRQIQEDLWDGESVFAGS